MKRAPEHDETTPSLGDPAVVSQLVHSFLAGVCERVAAVGQGTMARDAAVRADRAACMSAADVFLGKNPAYESVGQWNTGGGMVDWMLTQLKHVYERPDTQAGRDKIVANVFGWGVAFTYEAISAHQDDESDADLQDDLANLANDLTGFLLGVPGHFEKRLFEYGIRQRKNPSGARWSERTQLSPGAHSTQLRSASMSPLWPQQ